MSLRLGKVAVSGLQLRNHVTILTGTTVPTDGETGAHDAGPGSLYVLAADHVGALYVNAGTRSVPAWKQVVVS